MMYMIFQSNHLFVLGSQSFSRNSSYGQDENQDQLALVLARELRIELDQIS
jgi:hypothetical protein